VHRGAPAALRVVVHLREVVVHEGVRVHQLDGARDRKHCLGIDTACECGTEGECRAQTLAPGEDGIAHRLMKTARDLGPGREERVEIPIDARAALGQESFGLLGGDPHSPYSSSGSSERSVPPSCVSST
jgi:hypothetical protein